MSAAPPRVTFNRPMMAGAELDYIHRAVDEMHTAGDGRFTREASELLRTMTGAAGVLLTPSCTDALEMTALLTDIGPDDEVIVPSFAFVSTINAFVLRGARPVFVDVRADTLNLDERLVAERVGERTKAIVPLHYAGVGCEMDELARIAGSCGATLIEDNAHGLLGRYRGRPLGSFGPLSTLSFHETKNFICGEGGALVVNDEALIERAEIVRDKGTNRQQLFRGQVDKYTWVDLGSSFVLSDLLAAFLLAQLEAAETIQRRRGEIWRRYDAGLRGHAAGAGLVLPHVPADREQSFHMYWLMTRSLDERQALTAHLDRLGIDTAFHYQPLHTSTMGRRLGGATGDCPVTERAGECLLRLPFHRGLSDADVDRVLDAISSFAGAR